VNDTIGPLPAWDPDFSTYLSAFPPVGAFEDEMATLIKRRSGSALRPEAITRGGRFMRTDVTISRSDGTSLEMTVLSPRDRPLTGAIVWLHSGGMCSGDPLAADVVPVLDLAEVLGLAVVAVRYSLGPERPWPAGAADAYGALCWTLENAARLAVPPGAIFMHGLSGGGGLAASAALRAQREGVMYRGLMLDGPMLDDRMRTPSYEQHRSATVTAMADIMEVFWRGALGNNCARRGEGHVEYPIPGRQVETDLSGLPPAFLCCGANDPFRDEVADLARSIWRSGGSADLHIWAGVPHATDIDNPASLAGAQTAAAREGWYRRLLRAENEQS
jgi:acetyl esterase/lipase